MKKFLQKRLKNEKGLTLVELLAVIVILGIIAAIAVPAVGNIIGNTKDKAILADASNILSGAKLASADGSCDGSGNDITCNADQLKEFVEGIDLTGSAVKKDANGWTVTYPALSEIKNNKYKVEGSSVSETRLNELLGNKKSSPTEDGGGEE